ncbi:hypothetical protein APLC1_1869 [Limnospira platensis C1]|nr:hypothetical protein APLC1_1869 [Arthrospira platensis C1]
MHGSEWEGVKVTSLSTPNKTKQGTQSQKRQTGNLNDSLTIAFRVKAVATPSFGNHKPRIEAGNGRREVEPTTRCDHCQPSMIRETECSA